MQFLSNYLTLRPNSPAPLTDDWKVMDNSSINFHDVLFFIFCYNLAKNEEKHIMEIYRWVVRNFPVVHKWTRWIRPLTRTYQANVFLLEYLYSIFFLNYVMLIYFINIHFEPSISMHRLLHWFSPLFGTMNFYGHCMWSTADWNIYLCC